MAKNDVRPGMRFRGSVTGRIFTATSMRSDGNWNCTCGGVDIIDGANLRTGMYEPIAEPAPELSPPPEYRPCTRAKEAGCKRWAKNASACRLCTYGVSYETMAAQFGHDWVPPQAKPVSAGALQNVGSIGPAGDLIPAKPVLREPKPRADGYPDVCLECRGEKGRCLWVCDECAQTVDIGAHEIAWDARHPKSAAKDIPSGATNAANPVAPHTEAARGGEAAITSRCIFCGTPGRHRCPQLTETGPSAVAAAPAIEPWRPSVDDDFWIPDAHEGWRR